MDAPLPDQRNLAGDEAPILGLLSATSIEEARRVSAPLLQTSVAARLAKDVRLARAFEIWWLRSVEPANPERLETLAMLWRLTSLSAMNSHRRDLVVRIASGIRPDLPRLSTLQDPKDRRAAAEALLLAPPVSWLATYAADAIVSDPDPKSDARDAMCAVLLRQTANIGTTFSLLGERFADLRLQQQDPATGRARRVAWILRSLRAPLFDDEAVEAGDDFGGHFNHFVSRALGAARTAERSAFIDSAREIILTLNTVVRLHGLSVATHAETYSAIETLRRRFEATEWPEELQEPVERLSTRVAEALLVLARQGIADAGLRRVFITLLGHVFAGTRLRRLVAASEGLDAEIAYWLETGQARQRLESAGAIEETATSMVDLELARALREAFLADQALEHGNDPERALARMARELRAAARKRGIVLRGQPGETVDFSPLEHDADASIMGHRRVKLVTPLVERVAGGRSIAILIKAEVEA